MPIKIFIRRKFGSDTETQQVTAQQKAFLRVLPTKWRRKPAVIDMERNYVSVTCIPYCIVTCTACMAEFFPLSVNCDLWS